MLLETDESLADSRWHHVVAVQSGSLVNIYVDGLQLALSAETRASRVAPIGWRA